MNKDYFITMLWSGQWLIMQVSSGLIVIRKALGGCWSSKNEQLECGTHEADLGGQKILNARAEAKVGNAAAEASATPVQAEASAKANAAEAGTRAGIVEGVIEANARAVAVEAQARAAAGLKDLGARAG